MFLINNLSHLLTELETDENQLSEVAEKSDFFADFGGSAAAAEEDDSWGNFEENFQDRVSIPYLTLPDLTFPYFT